MRRSTLTVTALAVALAVVLVSPVTGWARTEVASLGGPVCCFDIGLQLTVEALDGQLRSVLGFAGRELLSVTLAPADAVKWGVPIVTVVTELQNARTDRLVSSRGNVSAR